MQENEEHVEFSRGLDLVCGGNWGRLFCIGDWGAIKEQ